MTRGRWEGSFEADWWWSGSLIRIAATVDRTVDLSAVWGWPLGLIGGATRTRVTPGGSDLRYDELDFGSTPVIHAVEVLLDKLQPHLQDVDRLRILTRIATDNDSSPDMSRLASAHPKGDSS